MNLVTGFDFDINKAELEKYCREAARREYVGVACGDQYMDKDFTPPY